MQILHVCVYVRACVCVCLRVYMCDFMHICICVAGVFMNICFAFDSVVNVSHFLVLFIPGMSVASDR